MRRRGRGLGTMVVPVTGVSRVVDVGPAVAAASNGLALRLTRADFEAGPVESRIEAFMAKHALQQGSTDVILDLGSVEQMIPPGNSKHELEFRGRHAERQSLALVNGKLMKVSATIRYALDRCSLQGMRRLGAGRRWRIKIWRTRGLAKARKHPPHHTDSRGDPLTALDFSCSLTAAAISSMSYSSQTRSQTIRLGFPR